MVPLPADILRLCTNSHTSSPVDQGWMQLTVDPVPPGQSAATQLPCQTQVLADVAQKAALEISSAPPGPADVIMEIQAVLADATSWADAGHQICLTQLPIGSHLPLISAGADMDADVAQLMLSRLNAAAVAPPSEGLTINHQADGSLTVSGPHDLSLVISGATGCIEFLCQGGVVMLVGPVRPCLYRAATDNDCGGFGGSSYAARWVAAGLDRLAVTGKVRDYCVHVVCHCCTTYVVCGL